MRDRRRRRECSGAAERPARRLDHDRLDHRNVTPASVTDGTASQPKCAKVE
jgi:hypothetical protein